MKIIPIQKAIIMSHLLETLSGQLDGQALQQIATQVGASEQKTRQAISLALPLLIGQMDRNTSDPAGAQSLAHALEKKHDGSILDNLAGFLSHPETGSGEGILGHVFGGRKPKVEEGVSKATGLDMQQVGRLLMILAPIVMGALGREKRDRGLDPDGVGRVLKNERKKAEEATGLGGLLSRVLDRDSDGSMVDDLMEMGGQVLGGQRRSAPGSDLLGGLLGKK